MSSHRRSTKYFSRKFNARKALLRGLINSLVEHERISTTVDRAKELRRHVERALTVGKRDTLSARRLLMSRIANGDTVKKIVDDLAPRFKDRAGGYTRIIKIGRRPGDTAEMAFIEFVDFDFKSKQIVKSASKADSKVESKAKAKAVVVASKEQSKVKKLTAERALAHRKAVRKIQAHSRAANRA